MTDIKVGDSKNSVIVGGSVSNSTVSVNVQNSDMKIFDDLQNALAEIDDENTRKSLEVAIEQMKGSVGTPTFATHYKNFMSIASDHVTVLSPFISNLAQLLV
ncbi:hypothetical protein [Aliikangiella coralliicola]|uniref:DUF4404 family protein n=1 Tax=Aliikangiella coralliicola TaxID=2592383 RepID=A0A545UIV2_9GAMM|nr:hypothetical protein [Aliikangiella coralliicola]TQV89388.1 hypothetical protein FLL46_00455 [Aliikangiella coralliicola]